MCIELKLSNCLIIDSKKKMISELVHLLLLKGFYTENNSIRIHVSTEHDWLSTTGKNKKNALKCFQDAYQSHGVKLQKNCA